MTSEKNAIVAYLKASELRLWVDLFLVLLWSYWLVLALFAEDYAQASFHSIWLLVMSNALSRDLSRMRRKLRGEKPPLKLITVWGEAMRDGWPVPVDRKEDE